MALAINTLDQIQQYLDGVAGRANHHAPNVTDVALTLAGAVLWRTTEDIEVRTYNGNMANLLWFHVGPTRYVLAYNPGTQEIELRERSQEGNTIATFTNATAASEVRRVFSSL